MHLPVQRLNKLIKNEQMSNFNELFFDGRFKDGCFIIWNCSKGRFKQFSNYLDRDFEVKIKIAVRVSFFWLKMLILHKNLTTTIYSKLTKSHLHLSSTSCHNPRWIAGIKKCVALQIKWIFLPDSERNIWHIRLREATHQRK